MRDLTEIGAAIRNLSDDDLPKVWSVVMRELRHRELVRSSNNPVADLAEAFVARLVEGVLTAKSYRGCDLEDMKGTRYQVKSRRLTTENKSRLLGQIRNLELGEFDYLVAVIFNEDFVIQEVWQIPHSQIEPHARYIPRTNSWALHCSGRLLHAPGVERLR
jgi:hypothetical protein